VAATSDLKNPQSAPSRGWTWPLGPQLAQAALEKSPSIIYIYDVQAEKSVFQNRRFSELLGHAPKDGHAENDWRRYIHDEDALAFSAYRERLKAIKPGEVLSWSFRMRNADGEWHHFAARDVLLESDEAGVPRLIVGNAADITEQKALEERKNLLLGEMRHRARNFAALMDALGRQSMPRHEPKVAEFFEGFMGRMRALLDTADAIFASDARTADLRAVAKTALAPFVNGRSQVMVDGPEIQLPESAAGNLALALHELATNATKYGALSRDTGLVAVSWNLVSEDGRRTVTLEWREQGGPEVTPPSHEGYGSRVIRNAMRGSNSQVTLDYLPQGVHCRIRFSLPQQHA
jgi:PAS domain S-box-containing protein